MSDIVVLNASHHADMPPGIRAHFISSGWSLLLAMATLPQVLRNIRIELIEASGPSRRAAIERCHSSIVRGGRTKMTAPAGLDLASIPERIQSEVRAALTNTNPTC